MLANLEHIRRCPLEVYLDNSATTKISQSAAEAMERIIRSVYGNPSSLHAKGLEAERELKAARRAVADSVGAEESEIVFTSGGTEANNLAVLGAARARKKRGSRIVTTAIEHSSVFEACRQLEEEGFEVVFLEPDESGHISEDAFSGAIDENTILVSAMLVNNELGTILPVERIQRIIKRKNAPALFHCDAVQGYGKLPIRVKKLGCDLMTVSAHKIHGPKGCGALFIKKGVYVKPLVYGGEQERRIRPGTEALPLICGFGAAAGEIGGLSEKMSSVTALRDYTLSQLLAIDGVEKNSPDDALPYIINVSATGVRSETMLHFLEGREIYISSGSACSKGKKSHVLSAMSLPDRRIDSALRISFSYDSSKEEADALTAAVREGMETLVKAY